MEELADAGGSLTIDEVAARLGVHRSIAYRLLRTLEDHRLVARDASGAVALGPKLAALAASVSSDLTSAALPELTAVANDLQLSCFLAVRDGDDCITVASVAPQRATAAVVQRPGAQHSLTLGAPGRAILSLMPPAQWPQPVDEALQERVAAIGAAGHETSHDEVIPGVESVAVPLGIRGQPPAAIAIVRTSTAPESANVGDIAARLIAAAAAIRVGLGG